MRDLNYKEFLLYLCGIHSSMFLSKDSYAVDRVSQKFDGEFDEVISSIIRAAHPEIAALSSRSQKSKIKVDPLYQEFVRLCSKIESDWVNTADFEAPAKIYYLQEAFPNYDITPLLNFLERVQQEIYQEIKSCSPKKTYAKRFNEYKERWSDETSEIFKRARSETDSSSSSSEVMQEESDSLGPVKKRGLGIPLRKIKSLGDFIDVASGEASVERPVPENVASVNLVEPVIPEQIVTPRVTAEWKPDYLAFSTFKGNQSRGSVSEVKNFPMQINMRVAIQATEHEVSIAIENGQLTITIKGQPNPTHYGINGQMHTPFSIAGHEFVLSITGEGFQKFPLITPVQNSAFTILQPKIQILDTKVSPKQAIVSIVTSTGPVKFCVKPTDYNKFEITLKRGKNDTRSCDFEVISEKTFVVGDRLYSIGMSREGVIKVYGERRPEKKIAFINADAFVSGFNFENDVCLNPNSVNVNLTLYRALLDGNYDGFVIYTSHTPENFAKQLNSWLFGSPLECISEVVNKMFLLTKTVIEQLAIGLGIPCVGVCTPNEISKESALSARLNTQIANFENEIEQALKSGNFTEQSLEDAVNRYRSSLTEIDGVLPKFPKAMTKCPEIWEVRKLISHVTHSAEHYRIFMDIFESKLEVCQKLMDFELRPHNSLRVLHVDGDQVTQYKNFTGDAQESPFMSLSSLRPH